MALPFPRASVELDYPLYAVDFDPEDANRLVVGGGGGAGRSGVGNKITVLETASQDELRVAGELDLSRDEDSVMSLAMGGRKGKASVLYAGVNSSPASIAKGKNEHLRALSIEQSKARASTGAKVADVKIAEVARASLFTDPEPDTYQRLLRIAGSMGAAATAMGKEPQLAVFETAGMKSRGVMELPREAEDLDIVRTGENEFQVAYCHKHELYLIDIGKENSDPQLVYTMPDDAERPSFRSIRYLTPFFLLAVSNLPKRSGVLIQGLRLPTPGNENARVAVNARIPGKISATALAVANLNPPTSATASVGDTQFIVAIAAHDSSVSLYSLDHSSGSTIDLLANLFPLTTLKGAHGSDNITGLAFSTFVTPKTHVRQQFIKLASISLQKTVAVHSIPLKKHIDRAPRNKKGPPRPVRYITALKPRGPSRRPVIIFLSLTVLILAVIGQSILEIYGGSRPILGASKFVPSWHGTLRDPAHPPAAFLAHEFLAKLGRVEAPAAGETLVVWEDEAQPELKLDVHDPKAHGPGSTWEELGEEQREAWRGRLRDAGAWTQNMGENVFKGILFGELAGIVGQAVGA